ncbi:MAG: L-threonylcarbamoyladenylate synthase [Candidatus Omnitrophota bacterium]|nr:threonylcarbamoyl-AMP synthase [Candidatus Omnitrophota bacterium]
MKTEILEIDPSKIDKLKIKKAARVIKNGGLVAFPTETVYGLGADALNPSAGVKIFEAKNRPLDDPLIVHIAEKNDLFKIAKEIHKIALDLTAEFWPGPLTLVLKKSEIIPDIITGGLNTVAVRMPSNPVALSLIKEARTPLAAPSANLFGRPSPTTAQHVLADLTGKIDLIIDGGRTNIGVESTIVDLTRQPFCVLRPGGVSLEKLRAIIPQVELFQPKDVLAPGMYPRHYAPRARVILVQTNGKARVGKVRKLAAELESQGYSFGILTTEENRSKYGDYNVESLGPGADLAACAANLFSVLRDFDRQDVDVIIAEGVKEEGLGLAIMDRLRKAAGMVKEE